MLQRQIAFGTGLHAGAQLNIGNFQHRISLAPAAAQTPQMEFNPELPSKVTLYIGSEMIDVLQQKTSCRQQYRQQQQ